jgi:hypothetical protein
MYAVVENNNITQFINYPKSIVIGDVRYPAKIFQVWSQSEKEAIGIYEIITDSTNYKDPAYYNNTNEEYTFANNKVVKSWGTATAKRLEDENAVDENGDPVLQDGVQVINYGLKTEKKKIVKQQASGLLAPTDWYVVKATEVADYDVPANILSFRADVRTKSNEMETMINNCTTVDELKALYEYTNTGTEQNPVMTRPLGRISKRGNIMPLIIPS